MSLATIAAQSLPPQVYAHVAEHDVTATADPARFRPIASTDGWVKPTPGTGLWTATVTENGEDGRPVNSGWLEYIRREMSYETDDLLLTEIIPAPSARILLIDDQQHLINLVAAYPAVPRWSSRQVFPDWVALAAAGWDAVHLTEQGQWATRLPRTGPDLYSWDLECVLWLRHAYTVGTTVRPGAETAGAA